MAKNQPAKRGSAEPPTSSCLLICEDVLASVSRDKHYLNAVVNRIVAPKMPAIIGPYAAYVKLSNVYGEQDISLSFSHAATDQMVFQFDATSPKKSDPLESHTLILGIPQFKIHRPGRYIFSASHGGVPFATTCIEVVTVKKGKKKK